MLRRCVSGVLLLLSLGGEAAGLELGLRGGLGGADLGSDSLDRLEVFLRGGSDTRIPLGERWQARPYWALTAGAVESEGVHTGVLGLGGGARLAPAQSSLGLDVGISLVWFEDEQLDGRELGGPWQFTSHLGLYWAPRPHWGLAYRLQHTSNGGLYSENDGINMQTLELWYRWP